MDLAECLCCKVSCGFRVKLVIRNMVSSEDSPVRRSTTKALMWLLSWNWSPTVRVCSVISDSASPWTVSWTDSSVHGIFQARILEWAAICFSRGSSQPRDWTHVSCTSCIACGIFTALSHRRSDILLFLPYSMYCFRNNLISPFYTQGNGIR